MTCDEYLRMLSTARVGELLAERAGGHAAECENCYRVTQVVMEREQHMMQAYGSLDSGLPPLQVADVARIQSRRRIVARIYGAGVLIAIAMTVSVIFASRVAPRRARSVQLTESFTLRCLTAEQAGELIQPYIRSNGSTYYAGKATNVVTVRATLDEVMKVRGLLGRFDDPTSTVCAVPGRPAPAAPR